MSVTLYSYQKDAIDRLKNGSILYGGVGSGKSITSLAYYYTKVCNGVLEVPGKTEFTPATKLIPLYIITTARKREDLSWEKECCNFGLSTDVTKSYKQTKVVIDSWNKIKDYVKVENSFFIFDEQRVVGDGVWVKSFLKIVKNNQWILLSATPGDKWTDYVPVFIANGYYRNRTDFNRQHCIFNPYTPYRKIERYIGTGKLNRERNEILVSMKYKHEINTHSEQILVDYDKIAYSNVSKERWNIYKDQPCRNAGELCYVQRRVVNESPDRIQKTIDLIRKYDKIIIFYNFDYELELLRQVCDTLELPYGEWNGHNHDMIPQTDKWVYLVQYTAGAEGWNCIETNIIIFYSQNYSYKVMKQSAGRIDRLNTPFNELYYYHLVSRSSIDRGISSALKKKQNFNEQTFAGKLFEEKSQQNRR